MPSFPDRLAEAVRRRGPLCVGIDPRWESLPISIRQAFAAGAEQQDRAKAFEAFSLQVLDLVEPFCAVIKPQAAFFEQLGLPGFAALDRILKSARERGFVTILDAKRGDIASTAAAYAEAAFSDDVWNADALTVNPYLGADAVEPFVSEATKRNRGLFVLVRTSNPGSAELQDVKLATGQTWSEALAEKLAVIADRPALVGKHGYSSLGAVVGATQTHTIESMRSRLPKSIFLLPGYGTQGATADMTRKAFDSKGRGAIVSASRSILYAHREEKYKSQHGEDWTKCVLDAVQDMRNDLRNVLK